MPTTWRQDKYRLFQNSKVFTELMLVRFFCRHVLKVLKTCNAGLSAVAILQCMGTKYDSGVRGLGRLLAKQVTA